VLHYCRCLWAEFRGSFVVGSGGLGFLFFNFFFFLFPPPPFRRAEEDFGRSGAGLCGPEFEALLRSGLSSGELEPQTLESGAMKLKKNNIKKKPEQKPQNNFLFSLSSAFEF